MSDQNPELAASQQVFASGDADESVNVAGALEALLLLAAEPVTEFELAQAGNPALRQQFAHFFVTADGRLTDPQSNQQVGTLALQGNQLVLTYNYQSSNPPYQNTFQVPLTPLP